jgi:hypothetical protein
MTPAANGYSLAELLIALALSLVVLAGAFAFMDLTEAASELLPEAADLDQRGRVVSEALWRDLAMAGAGLDGGAFGGPLARRFAPVLPRRMGLRGADPATTATSHAITVIWVPPTLAQTTLAAPLSPLSLQLQVTAAPPCARGRPLCGLAAGAGVLIFDRMGQFDVFTLTEVRGDVGQLVHRADTPAASFAAGAAVAEAEMRTYYFDAVNHQVRQNDGYLSDVPLVDHVVGLGFEYFGVPALPDTGAPLVPLPIEMFADGPWYGAGATEFDADLLRVRLVRVTITLEATTA